MKQKRLQKKHLQKIIPAFILIGLVVWFVLWTASPKKAKTQTTSASQQTSEATYTIKDLDGTYIAFSYSGKYVARSEGPKNNELEIHTLSAGTNYNKQIIASVSNLPDSQISLYGAYIYRKLHTELYTTRKVDVAGAQVEVWVKNDGSEQTAMMPRGNKVATVTFMTASNSDDLTTEADAFLKTFRWKQ